MGEVRIKKNLELFHDDVAEYCKSLISNKDSIVHKQGKNFYLEIDNIVITINSSSYTIITARKIK